MKKEEFKKWFDENTCYESHGHDCYRNLVDYADCRWDEISIDENSVTYRWEDLYWGGSNWEEREFTFEEFIEAYKNDSIKY